MRHEKLSEINLSVKSFILVILVTFFFAGINVQAQKNSPDEKQIRVPSGEEFKPADGFITGAVAAGTRTIHEISDQDTIRIYNADGSLWYEFNYFNRHSPLFYKKNPKPEYKPFSLVIAAVFIRLKAVSENWYEVVVNEETGDTKYTQVEDPILGRVRWEEILLKFSNSITFDKDKNPLRESPDGQVKSIQLSDNIKFNPKEIKGDWLYVTRDANIRWRSGADLLIGLPYNDWIVPKTQ